MIYSSTTQDHMNSQMNRLETTRVCEAGVSTRGLRFDTECDPHLHCLEKHSGLGNGAHSIAES